MKKLSIEKYLVTMNVSLNDLKHSLDLKSIIDIAIRYFKFILHCYLSPFSIFLYLIFYISL
mgnify:CR=1 FL=1